MIIGKIWDSEYPWDVRVEKICRTLTEAGHEVHLVCRNRGNAPIEEAQGGLTIHRMRPLPPLLRSLEGPLSFPAFINPRWYWLARNVFRDQSVDLIICRDLPLAPLALAVGRALGRPVIVDLAEHYPGVLRDLYNRHDFRLGNLLVRNPWLAALVERWALPRANGVWVVVEEMAKRLESLGVSPSRITLVSNTPLPERVARLSSIRSEPREPDTIRLVYLGNVESSRGLLTVLESLFLLTREHLQVTLDVIGDGSGLALTRDSASDLGLEGNVNFHGRIPYDEALNLLPHFDAGLIPHRATAQWKWTVQNKLFDYMAAGLPVIATSLPPVRRILADTGAGVTFVDRDATSLAGAVRALLHDPAARIRMGNAGRAAVRGPHQWAHDAARMERSLARLTPRSQHGVRE